MYKPIGVFSFGQNQTSIYALLTHIQPNKGPNEIVITDVYIIYTPSHDNKNKEHSYVPVCQPHTHTYSSHTMHTMPALDNA